MSLQRLVGHYRKRSWQRLLHCLDRPVHGFSRLLTLVFRSEGAIVIGLPEEGEIVRVQMIPSGVQGTVAHSRPIGSRPSCG